MDVRYTPALPLFRVLKCITSSCTVEANTQTIQFYHLQNGVIQVLFNIYSHVSPVGGVIAVAFLKQLGVREGRVCGEEDLMIPLSSL